MSNNKSIKIGSLVKPNRNDLQMFTVYLALPDGTTSEENMMACSEEDALDMFAGLQEEVPEVYGDAKVLRVGLSSTTGSTLGYLKN